MTTLTQPGGELPLGLPTLLTMHRVNAEVKRTQTTLLRVINKPKRFKQPYFNATATHEQTLSFLTCEEGTRMNLGYREGVTACECLNWAHASRAQRIFQPYVRAARFIRIAYLSFLF